MELTAVDTQTVFKAETQMSAPSGGQCTPFIIESGGF